MTQTMNPRQDGFTIIEVLVAVVLMSIILVTLGGLTYATASQAIYASDASTSQAASLGMVNRLSTLPFNDLAGAAGCEMVGKGNNQYERCVTVTTTGSLARVQVVTTPQQRKAHPTTVNLVRTRPPTGNPLCTTC
jgi:prepilin-type N-terminal cleavage/methylation domain-containing protein